MTKPILRNALILAAALLLAAPAAITAQPSATIAEGMTTQQVRSAFGAPATVRMAGDWSYWYYHNGCPRRCGSDDVVFFRGDRVIAAVLRTRARRFSGPAADRALEAAGSTADRAETGMYLPAADGVTVGEVRVESTPATVIVVQPDTVQAGAVTGTDLVVEPAAEPESSVDRAHQRNVEQERESAVDRARRLREERQP